MTSEIQRLEGKLETFGASLGAQMTELTVKVAQLQSSVMQRHEIEEADARRVAVETYASDQREVTARLTRLEASPTRMIGYIGGATGCLGVLMSMAMGGFFILEFVLTHYKP